MNYIIWGANLSGGFLRADVEQERDNSFTYNQKLVELAEKKGINAILYATRYLGAIGGSESEQGQLDPLTLMAALIPSTQNIHFISAVLPGFISPVTLAKMGATLDIISNGRFHINLVSGWFKEEQEIFGIEWIDHKERYARSKEYLEVLKGLWTQESFSYKGNYYQLKDAHLSPKPVQKPYPAIYQGGNSLPAQTMAAEHSDIYFMNGALKEELYQQITVVKELAKKQGRELTYAVNAFVIARQTEKEAYEEYQWILDRADEVAIKKFQERTESQGMWKNAKELGDFVANNEGFRTGLIGSYETVTKKINELKLLGVDHVLLTFRKPLEELPIFFEKVVRKI
ncbi:LLM class flavin-dependent oxidoreductase [Alkalihalobacillus pseudalcaliphilus]|uniref:LLM class flavin-dependent oxidoreductase n=1 Tax=Alkalihalobacillus pseudalcaliphilus TaxID=79884 RepID=UPI00064D91BA|nr:LLM class flavin-dependent oxidoreductase [Alkalihalobacillus pseudalcaliphilus]KMK78215.1 alkanesulfonate monooxygenase [Alkalihalobacillus pseudalcaliphilus]